MQAQALEAKRTAEFIGTQTELLREQIQQRKWEQADSLFRQKLFNLRKWSYARLGEGPVYLNQQSGQVGEFKAIILPADPELALTALVDHLHALRQATEAKFQEYADLVIDLSKSWVDELTTRLVQLTDLVDQLSPELADFAEPLNLALSAEDAAYLAQFSYKDE